jgi:hypothetical protein
LCGLVCSAELELDPVHGLGKGDRVDPTFLALDCRDDQSGIQSVYLGRFEK